ncbi:metalloregulator ArsR/SmtB family transcription factor [Alicyclobacillus sp. SP_1]|jgi:ArsR family transcriptional regulator|uniref:ArsR/SmtB family transcription factor n=1 Tax=Alicyclobacillus sp. SP_1 TaxID=2942475 RepID=UPI00215878FD|nr:metalloregulator ArsR/SmtB family transcription factor [Alicyclobacillus sp. SP_1]
MNEVPRSLDEWADVYKALADKTRLHILALLKYDELCVCELVEVLDITQPGISQHLRKLRQAGLVAERKFAQWVFYRLDGEHVPVFASILEELPDCSAEIQQLAAKGLRVCSPVQSSEERDTVS